MRPRLLLFVFAAIACAPVPAARTALTPTDATREITAMLAHSAVAWNRGDLAAFVSDYAPNATFIGRKGLMRGTAAITSAYQPRFVPGATRDSLSFEDIDVDLLAPDLVNVVAYYKLIRGDSTTARGPTSLVMRRIDGRWRILHDHSS